MNFLRNNVLKVKLNKFLAKYSTLPYFNNDVLQRNTLNNFTLPKENLQNGLDRQDYSTIALS